MANGIRAFVAKVSDPAWWCVVVVAGMAPVVVPAPYGYVVGGIVGAAMVLGLALIERMDGRELDDQEQRERRREPTRFGKPVFDRKVRLAAGRGPARATS